LYDTNGSGSDIKIYSRNTTTGILTYDSSFSSGLDLRYGIISNDGTNIYIEGVAIVNSVAVRRIYEFSLVNNSITYLGFVTIPNNDNSICNDPIIISSDDAFVYYGGTDIYGYQRTTSPSPPSPTPINPYCVSGAGTTSANGTYTFVSTPASFYSYGYWEKIGDTAYTFGYDANEEWWVIKNSSTYLYGANVSGYTIPPSMWSYTYGMGTSPPPYTASGSC
jgi:hypothetical protein